MRVGITSNRAPVPGRGASLPPVRRPDLTVLAIPAFVGAMAGPIDILLLPGRSRLLALRADLRRPQVIAASVHALGGAGLLEDVQWSEERLAGLLVFGPIFRARATRKV